MESPPTPNWYLPSVSLSPDAPAADLEIRVLYSFRRCPYAMRARMALHVAALRFETCEVALRAKPPELLSASPKGTVPVLVFINGQVIEQSLEIMRWALARPGCEHWLQTAEHPWIADCDRQFKLDLDGYKYPGRGADPAHVHRDRAATWLHILNAQLACTVHLTGAEPSFVDLALLPFVRQFAAIAPEWWRAQPWPALQRWLHVHLESALFTAIMRGGRATPP